MKVVVTCEHGGNKIPNEFSYLFKDRKDLLQTHKGYDPGALELAEGISKRMGDYFYFSQISRLLVESNRSIKNPKLFSEFSKNLNREVKREILEKYYFPFRNKAERLIKKLVSGGEKVLHISVHTFTPVFNNKIRNADIGILYDPKRKKEKDFALLFRNELLLFDNNLKIRFNYPYLGISDGFTSYLRTKFVQRKYLGIELEVNQKFILNEKYKWTGLKQNLMETLNFILNGKLNF